MRAVLRAFRNEARDMWAIGLRPRVADPDRGIKLIKSDLCATDVAGIRYGSRIGNGVIMRAYRPRSRVAAIAIPVPVFTPGEADAH